MQLINEKNVKWWVFFAAAMTIMMVDIDITASNLALATIAHDLNIGMSTVQWIIDGYLIAATSLMAFTGRLSDLIGYRRTFLFGLGAFILASLAVGLSIGPWSIMISRIAQGACIAFTFPIAIALVRLTFPPKQRGFAIGCMVAIAGFSEAFGPTFGGLVITFLNWRFIFLLNVPLAAIAFVVAYFTVPKYTKKTKPIPLNMSAVVIFILGLLALMTALNGASRWEPTSVHFIGALLFGILLISAFAIIEFLSKEPILELRLLENHTFACGNIIRMCVNFIYFTLLFTLGLLLQNILGYSSLHTGYLLLAMTLAMGICSMPAGKLIDAIGAKKPLFAGMFMLAIGTLMLLSLNWHSSQTFMITAFVITGVAISLAVPASVVTALFSVERKKTGAGFGMFFTNSFLAGSLGVAISGLLLSLISQNRLQQLLTQSQIHLTAVQYQRAKQIAVGAHSITHNGDIFTSKLFHQLTPILKESFLFSFSATMILCSLLALFACYIAYNLKLKKAYS